MAMTACVASASSMLLIVDGKGGDARAFDVEHTFQSAARTQQRHRQFRSHFAVGVKGPINLGPRRLAQIVDANGLSMQRGPAHDAAVFADRQAHFGIIIPAADRHVLVQRFVALFSRPERSVIGLDEFQRHVENFAQRIVQMQARTDQAAGVLQAFQFVDLALQGAVDALILARVVNGDSGQLHEGVEDQQLVGREVPIGIQAEVQRPDRLPRHQQRVTRGGANARIIFQWMKGDVGFFVRQHASAAGERRGADTVGARGVVDERALSLAG